jgi:GTPase SAR1 family protein
MKSEKVMIRRFDVLIIGSSAVGKTSILQRWAEDDFKVKHMPTLGKITNILYLKSQFLQPGDVSNLNN